VAEEKVLARDNRSLLDELAEESLEANDADYAQRAGAIAEAHEVLHMGAKPTMSAKPIRGFLLQYSNHPA
jgi:hypothetical protein